MTNEGIYQEVYWCEEHQNCNDGCPDSVSIGWWLTFNVNARHEQEN